MAGFEFLCNGNLQTLVAMMKGTFTLLVSVLICGLLAGLRPAEGISWKMVDEGLALAEFAAPQKSAVGDSKITVVRIDPARYQFTLLNAGKKGEKIRTAPQWARDKNQLAVINAGMYQTDYVTNVGYMRDFEYVNNGRLNKDNTVVAFNRKVESVPEFQIIDRECQNWEELKDQYHSFTQGIRMVDCHQKNKWGQQPRKWSMAVIGKDKQGRALFIFSRSPYTVHDFIQMLLQSDLQLYNAMYLEGGPEASLYLNHQGTRVEKMGSYETDFNENDDNHEFWPIPNVIGVSRK